MIDKDLFIRGHILTKIDDEIEDYDCRIPDYYFMTVLNLTGEVIDSNGSQYKLIKIDEEDNFVIEFDVDEVEFEEDNGDITSFRNLVVLCAGKVIQVDDYDVLEIEDYNVTKVV